MSKVHTRISSAVLAAAVAAAAPAAFAHDHGAQGAPAAKAEKPHHTFDDIDTNKDGVISRAEFDAAHAAKPAAAEHACGEGKCGEGKCGGQRKAKAATPAAKAPAAKAKAPEHTCGEGKCGSKK